MIKKIIIILVLFVFFIFRPDRISAVTLSAPIIIDHTAISRFEAIPTTYLTSARNLRLFLRRASTGGLILQGLNELAAANPVYNRSNWDFQDRGNPGWQAKVDEFVTQAAAQQSTKDVLSMKFCYIDPDANWVYYRDRMLSVEAAYPNKYVIWWTIPIMTSSAADRATQAKYQAFNDSVRNYARANNKILFDIADIESHDPNGNRQTSTYGYEVLYSGYSSDGGHPDSTIARNRLAKAFWVGMAQIAGWNTQTVTPTTPTSLIGDADGDGDVDGVDYTKWLNHYGSTHTNGPSWGDFNSNGVTDGVDYTLWLNRYGIN